MFQLPSKLQQLLPTATGGSWNIEYTFPTTPSSKSSAIINKIIPFQQQTTKLAKLKSILLGNAYLTVTYTPSSKFFSLNKSKHTYNFSTGLVLLSILLAAFLSWVFVASFRRLHGWSSFSWVKNSWVYRTLKRDTSSTAARRGTSTGGRRSRSKSVSGSRGTSLSYVNAVYVWIMGCSQVH
ncbi:unnamed protein product [Ambrosiozyma monospora]|uniref:Unnamed protein product n=1 Tax=Ambrosiozyma monospora TaxID=43982 RepID=A0ACB5T858_AMBMO|nr:unnamed protein product [Ambrosiozyma monospora]